MRIGMIIAAVFLFLTAVGCSKKGPEQIVSSQDGNQQALSWSIKLVSVCVTGSPEDCVAHFGFSANSDGNYTVGPGPQGQLLSGPLSKDELELLSGLIGNTTDTLVVAAEETCIGARESRFKDTIKSSVASSESEIVRLSDAGFCFRLSSSDRARQIHALMREFAERYYPLPFPDDSCTEAIAELESLHGLVRGCSRDVDCSYFDSSYAPIATDVFQFVVTSDCSGMRPLVVANYKDALNKQKELLDQFNRAKLACKKISRATACSGFGEFLSTLPSPVCAGNVCRVNPASGTFPDAARLHATGGY